MTLDELSQEVGISRSSLGAYEQDNYAEISPYSFKVLARYYGVSEDYLYEVGTLRLADLHQ